MSTPVKRVRSRLKTDHSNGLLPNEVVEHVESYEVMTDYEYPDWIGKRLPANPCDHVKLTVNCGGFTRFWYTDWWYGQATVPDNRLPLSSGQIEHFLNAAASLAGDPLAATPRAWLKLITQMPTDVELGNFLLELRESLMIVPDLLEAYEKWLEIKRQPDAWARQIKQTDPDVLSHVSNHYLLYIFGIAPLVDELKALRHLGESVAKKVERLRRMNGKTSKRRAGPWALSTGLPAVRPETVRWGTGCYQERYWTYTLEDFADEFRAQARLEQNLEGLDAWDGIAASYIAATGLNNPMAVVYNALPLSFVSDWFAPIGTRLQMAGATPIRGVWNITDRMWSYKYQARWKLRAHWRQTHHTWQSADIGYLDVERYQRDIYFPDFPLTFPMSAGQALTAGALAKSFG